MNRPDEPTTIQPLPEPGADPVATLLAETLSSEAALIDPRDRLAEIRSSAERRRRPWLPVAAGAAAVLVIGGGAWAALVRSEPSTRATSTIPTPAGPAAVTGPSPTGAPTLPRTAPSASASAEPSGAGTFAVPVYYLGRDVDGLFREFHREATTPGPMVGKVQIALQIAMNPGSATRPEDVSPWLPGTSQAVSVSMAGARTVVVTLPDTERSARGRTSEQARLAAQQLAWTATAVLQDASVGVQLRFTSGSGQLFGSLSTSQTFHRPSAALAYQDLSPIWVLTPAVGATVSSPVVVSGQECTFEANVAWQLFRGSTLVTSGRLTGSGACPPGRGTWSVTLRALAPGAYTFRAYEPSPKGGSALEGLDLTTFTVR
jgi:hypothetical protein